MITLYGEIHSSKNSRQIYVNRGTGKPFVAKSKSSKADEQMLSFQLMSIENVNDWERMRQGLEYPYWVAFMFIREKHARWDFSNLVQGVADALVKAGYLPDDDVDHFIPVYAGHDYSKVCAGVRFWILKPGDSNDFIP